MIGIAVSYDLEPLRCSTCDGRGWVDNTANYLRQWNYFYDGAGPPSAPCRVCDGTGRHVSRARAGLAAPPMMLFDIETGGLHSNQKSETPDLVIIDDPYVVETPEQRATVRSWFEADPPWRTRHSLAWWAKEFAAGENPQIFPDGLSGEVSSQLAADLHAISEASNVFILGDPDDEEERR